MIVENAESLRPRAAPPAARACRPQRAAVLVRARRRTRRDGGRAARLAVLEQTSDGFLIAEKDLEARGPGDLLGTRQSGLPSLRVADPVRDLARLPQARREILARRDRRTSPIASDLFGYP